MPKFEAQLPQKLRAWITFNIIFPRTIIILTMIATIILASVIGSAMTNPLRLSAVSNHIPGRHSLSHARVVLEYYQSQQHQETQLSLRRHDLSQHQAGYEQAPLITNHYGFTLQLKVNGINYKMSMDTGSSDIFIKGQNAPGVPKNRYKSNQNYKSKPVIKIGYLDGDLKTYQTTLPVQFNSHKFDTPMLVAYTAPPQFQDVEGLIGLSYPSLARHQPTFIQTLIKNNIISEYAYGMNLNLIQPNRSFVSFGEKDTELFEGVMEEYPISHSKQISIDFNYVRMGNKKSNKKMRISKALLDTGNTCISIPQRFQSQILKAFNSDKNRCAFMVEENVEMFSLLICKITDFDSLPKISLSIGKSIYDIEKQFYLQRCTQKQSERGSKTYYCDTYIESVDYPRGEMIFLGDAFFNRFYTFFDLQNQKVGIAKNKENITLQDILEGQQFQYDESDWVALNQRYG